MTCGNLWPPSSGELCSSPRAMKPLTVAHSQATRLHDRKGENLRATTATRAPLYQQPICLSVLVRLPLSRTECDGSPASRWGGRRTLTCMTPLTLKPTSGSSRSTSWARPSASRVREPDGRGFTSSPGIIRRGLTSLKRAISWWGGGHATTGASSDITH